MRTSVSQFALLLLSCSVWVLAACAEEYDHFAETNVQGITLRVGLKHSHPFLAEYKRFLEVEVGGIISEKEIFPDTGGYTWVVVANNHGKLEVSDLGGVQYSTSLTGNTVQREYLGRFDFGLNKTYGFIPASSDPREPQAPK